MIVALYLTLERESMRLGLFREGDWAGIVTMAIGLSALQTLLEEGNKDDWFGSPFIVRLGIIAAVFLTAFLVIELTVKNPLVNLRLLLNRNFGVGTVANVLVGFALFGSIYVLPQYLGQVQGYNAEQIGLVLAWTGLPQLVLIPFVPWLMKRFDIRYIGSLGILIFAASCFMNTTMSIDYSGDQLWLPNIVRAIGQALIITPLTAVAMFGIRRKMRAMPPACSTCCATSEEPSVRRRSPPSSPSVSSFTPTSSASRLRYPGTRCGKGSRRSPTTSWLMAHPIRRPLSIRRLSRSVSW